MTSDILPKWTGEYYFGPRFDDYYIAYTHNRDSDILEESNYQTMKQLFQDHDIVFIEKSFNHWGVGWIEMLLIHEDEKTGIEYTETLHKALSDYPLLNDEDFSEREHDCIEESRESWFISDFIHGVNNNLGIELKDDTDTERDNLLELSRNIEEKTNTYWNVEGSGCSIDIERIIKGCTIEDLKKYNIPFEVSS